MPKRSKSTVKSKPRKTKSKSKKASKKGSAKLNLETQPPKEVEQVEEEDEEEENEDDLMSIVQVLPGEEDFFSIDKNDTTLPRNVKFCKQRRAFTRFVMKTSGIKAAIVRAFVCLYEDTSKPDNAIGYITSLLGGDLMTTNDVKNMLAKMQELRNKIEKLEDENEKLRKRVEALDLRPRSTLDLPEDLGEYDEEEIENYQSYQRKQSSQIGSCVDSNLSFSFKW